MRNKYIEDYIKGLNDIILESTNTKKFKDRTLQVIRDFFKNASWLDNEFIDSTANPEHLSVINYIEKKFKDEFFHGNVHQTVMRLEPIMMNIVLNLGFEQEEPDAEKLNRLRQIVHYISAETDRNRKEGTKPDFDISKMTIENTDYENLDEIFGRILDDRQKEEDERLNSTEFSDEINLEYEILSDIDYKTAHEYGNYSCPRSKLCYTQSETTWNQYTQSGRNTVYLILKKDWKEIPDEHGPNTPYDEYGLSMIFVFVDPSGNIAYSNTRWNHEIQDNPHTQVDHSFTKEQISKLLGINFNRYFKPSDKFKTRIEESLFEYKKTKDLKAFDEHSDFVDGWAIITIMGYCNFINEAGDLKSPEWLAIKKMYDNQMIIGNHGIIEKDGKYNFINTKGILYKPDDTSAWFDWAHIYKVNSNEIALDVMKYTSQHEGNHNILSKDGTFHYKGDDYHQWPNRLNDFYEGFALFQTQGGMYNFMNADGDVLYRPDANEDEWFSSGARFKDGKGRVELTYKDNSTYNFIDKSGNLLLDIDKIGHIAHAEEFNDGFAVVRFDDQYPAANYIDENGNILLKKNVYTAQDFYYGYGEVNISAGAEYIAFVDKTGKIIDRLDTKITPYGVDAKGEFSEGWAVVTVNAKYNYVDEYNNLISTRWFDFCKTFQDGCGVVKIGNEYNFITEDSNGECIMENWIDEPFSFYKGLAPVETKSYVYNIIDKSGNFIENIEDGNNYAIEVLEDGNEGFKAIKYEFRQAGKWDNSREWYNIMTEDGRIISDRWFDMCDAEFTEGFAIIVLGEYCNFINKDGELLYEPDLYPNNWFNEAEPFKNGWSLIRRWNYGLNAGELMNLLDKDGNLLLDWRVAPNRIYGDISNGSVLTFNNQDKLWNILTDDGKYIFRLGFEIEEGEKFPLKRKIPGSDSEIYILINKDGTFEEA